MIFVALSEAADRGELILCDGGFCRFHRRRDSVVVIREILVLPERRRQGIGEAMFRTVLASHGNGDRVIRAKCPIQYTSGNFFWRKMGFTMIEEKGGINLWQRPSHP